MGPLEILGCDLHEVMPRLAQDLMWTHDLSRKDAALTTQFLSGHYATQAYLRALDTQLMVATDGVMALWTTGSTVSFIALALSFSDSSFAHRLRWTRVGLRLGSGIS